MNAQEAIEKKQMYVDRLKSRVLDLEKEIENPYEDSKHYLSMCRRNHADLQRELEMESIVLESAKLLHGSNIKVNTYHDFKVLSAYVEIVSVEEEQLSAIGIETGEEQL